MPTHMAKTHDVDGRLLHRHRALLGAESTPTHAAPASDAPRVSDADAPGRQDSIPGAHCL